MSETCQKLAFTHPIVVLKSGLKNNWMKKLDRVNRPWRHFFIFSAWSLKIHLALFLSHNFTPVIMPEMQYNKLTMWYFILLYFSASDLLIGSQQAWCHHRFFDGKILRVYCCEKKSACQVRQDRLSNHPNYFVFHFILVHLFYGHTKRLLKSVLEQD